MDQRERIERWVRWVMDQRGYTAGAQLARACRVPPSTITRALEKHGTSIMTMRTIGRITDATGLPGPQEWSKIVAPGGALPPAIEPILRVPLISWVQAGALMETNDPGILDDCEKRVPLAFDRGSIYALRVREGGISRVAPVNSIIFIDYQDRSPVDGAYYALRVGGEYMARQFRSGPDRFEPDAMERGFSSIFPHGNVEILGRIVAEQTNL